MKLYNWLSEEKKFENAVSLIKEHCSKYIKDLKNPNQMLLLGNKTFIKSFDLVKINKKRLPRDTSLWVHDGLNDYYEKIFKERIRETCAFATLNYRQARYYGSVYYMFPTGNYSIFYSDKIEDLTNDLHSDFLGNIPNISLDKEFNKYIQYMLKRPDLISKKKLYIPENESSPGYKLRYHLTHDEYSKVIWNVLYSYKKVNSIDDVKLKETNNTNELMISCDSFVYLFEDLYDQNFLFSKLKEK